MENGTSPTHCDAPQVERSLKDRIVSLEKAREELIMRVTMLEEQVRQLQRFTGVNVPPSAPKNY